MVQIVKRECLLCDKSLKVIGRQRVNGQTTYDDWTERLFHKHCDKIVKICLIHTLKSSHSLPIEIFSCQGRWDREMWVHFFNKIIT